MKKLASILLAGCLASCFASESTAWVAKVDEVGISRADVEYKLKIERAYGNQAITVDAVAVALINDAIEREVARKAGVAPTPEEVRELEKFSDATSKAPELLRQIKEIFGADQASYYRLFLEPRITNRKLRYYYSTSAELHREERALIEKVQAAVRGGKTIGQAAQAAGLPVSESEVEDRPMELPAAMKQYLAPGEPAPKDPLIALLEKLPEGGVYPDIVEDDSCYRVIRLKGKSKKGYRIEAVSVNKKPFDAWFAAAQAKLHVTIADPGLAENIRAHYPGIAW